MTETDRWGHPVERITPQRRAPAPPMTRAETVAVLAAVVAYDNREPTEAVIAAWLAAAQDARWTRDEAITAVRQHYASSTEWIMPAHVTERVRAARQDRAMRADTERDRVVDAASATKIRDLCAEYGLTHFSIADDTREHPRGLHVDCPSCKARRGDACTHPTRGALVGYVHPSRLDAEHAYIASRRSP
jgi:hypothetical protein